MHRRTAAWASPAVAAVVAAALTVGCESSGRLGEPIAAGHWSGPVRTGPMGRAEATRVARTVLSQWFSVERADAAAGLIETLPVEYTDAGSGRKLSETIVPRPVPMRRVARIRIDRDGNGQRLWVQVRRQRLDTADHQMLRQHRDSDSPTQTPIETGAGVSAGQRQVWSDAGYDRPMEGQIIQSLQERFGGPAATTRP